MGTGVTITRVLCATAVVLDLLTFLIIADGSTTGAVIRVASHPPFSTKNDCLANTHKHRIALGDGVCV